MLCFLERKVYNPIDDVCGGPGGCDRFQILDTLPDRDILLMRVDDTPKGDPRRLPFCCLGQQVIVLSKEHSSQACRAIEEIRVSDLMRLIFEGGHHVHLPQP
jgi:hypothetical protein